MWDVLGGLTLALLAVVNLINLTIAWQSVRAGQLLQDEDWYAMDEVMEQMDALVLPSLGAFVVAGVVFLAWLGCVWVSDRSDPAQHQMTCGLAVGGWFIPVACYVLGGKALTQLWRGVQAARARELGKSADVSGTPAPIVVWWIGFVLLGLTPLVMVGAAVHMESIVDVDELPAALEFLLGTLTWNYSLAGLTGVLLMIVVLQIMGMTKR